VRSGGGSDSCSLYCRTGVGSGMRRTQSNGWWDGLLHDASGAEIAAGAVVLPLLFMLLFGIMWFARAFNIYTTVNRAARQGALAEAANNCATCGNSFRTSNDIREQSC